MSPAFRRKLPKEVKECHIIDYYRKAIQGGEPVGAVFHDGYWRDLGTPAAYWESTAALGTDESLERLEKLGITSLNAALGNPYRIVMSKSNGLEPPVVFPTRQKAFEKVSLGPHTYIYGRDNSYGQVSKESLAHCLFLDEIPSHLPTDARPRIFSKNHVVTIP